MCLVLFAWKAHPRYRLVVAANREEFHRRPTAAADFWAEQADLLAGRDLQAGGTWLGLTRSGRFAAITNYREPATPVPTAQRSRGHLVRDFLASDVSPYSHARGVSKAGGDYSGFNLILADADKMAYVSNRDGGPAEVEAGCHGLSNHLLDTDWPKVHSGKQRLRRLLNRPEVRQEDLFKLLTDRTLTPGDLPDNVEDGLVPELLTRHYFIISPEYGTRSSTVVLVRNDGRATFAEREFGPGGEVLGTREFQL